MGARRKQVFAWNRAARSFVALLTMFSVACSGRACGTSGPAANNATSVGTPTGVGSDAGAQAGPSPQRVEILVQDFGRLLAGVRDDERLTSIKALERLQKLYGLLDAVSRTLPRDTFDFNTVTTQVGREPAKLRDWVRSHTALVPYRGVLRDAAGTLMDRVGNSLDRALLLARLVQESGGQARLARARLTADQASRLLETLERAAASGVPAPAAAADLDDAELASVAQQAGLTPEVLRSHNDRIGQAAAKIKDDVQARVKIQTAAIAQAVGMRNDIAGSGDSRAANVDALQDHWWVQWQDGGRWIDLDPAADGPAHLLAPAQETTDPGRLPADLHHQVEIRVVVEQWNGSQLTEASPVSVTARPSEVLGTAVEFRQIPIGWPTAQAGGAPDAAEWFRKAILAQREWLPTLLVGTRRISRASVTETGDLNDRPGSKPHPIAQPASGLADAFGGGDEPPPPPGVLTAEWLEYVIRVPGVPTRTIRREIFDLVGPASRAARRPVPALSEQDRWRRGLSLVGETDILLAGNHLSPAFIAHLTASRLQGARAVLESLATSGALSGQSAAERLSKVPRLPGPLHEVASARQQWSRSPALVYVAQPTIFARHMFPTEGLDGSGGMADAIDVVMNEIDARPAAGMSPQFARLEQGVLDANLEAWVLKPGINRRSTADVFGSGEQSGRWAVVRTSQDLLSLALAPDIRARVDLELQAGYVLLVARPTAESAAAVWWRINPQTGSVLAMGDRGWGQGLTDYATTLTHVGVGVLCSVIAGSDRRGFTWRDLFVCAATGGVAGGGVMAAIYTPALLGGIWAALWAAIGTGLWLNDTPWLDRPI